MPAASDRPLRVALGEDSYLVRAALAHLLEAEPAIEVVGTYADLDRLLAGIDAERPDVVVTDIRMPPTSTDEGLRAAEYIREHYPEMGVVILSQYTAPKYGLALLEHGSDGRAYLLKERVSHHGQLVAAIEAVAAGGSVIEPKVVEGLIDRRRLRTHSPLLELTARELEILALVARGCSNQSIADELVLTKRAVEKHINAIFMKLNLTGAVDVSRRVKAALIFLADHGDGRLADRPPVGSAD